MKKSRLDYVRCITHFSLFKTKNCHVNFMLTLVLFIVSSFQVQASKAIGAFNVSGRVTDETGQPLPGVNILEKGTTNGTTTDSNGSYKLTVTDGNVTIVFSFIGYATQDIEVNNRTVIDADLTPDTQSLNEVVVVG